MNLVVLISNAGTGTNLQAIIDGIEGGKISGKIVAVVSDKADAKGLDRARKHSLPIEICPKKEELLPLLKKLNPDYVCLAGWKQIILDEVINAFPNKILNLHPGIIPDAYDGVAMNPDGTPGLWNRGMLTTKAIQNFLDQHATYAGSSVHFLTLQFDFGPVLGRAFEKIEPGDTVESLYERLKKKENALYVSVLQKLTEELSTKYENSRNTKEDKLQKEDIIYRDECYKIVGILFSVYKELGGSLLEKHYQKGVAAAFSKNGIDFKEQIPVKIFLNGQLIGTFYVDFVITIGEAKIVLEIKKHENFGPKNIDQVKSYIKALNNKLGILANFTHSGVKYKRIVNLYNNNQ